MTLLGAAVAGIHTMTDEHFGISVVEFMAAGAIPIGRHCDHLSLNPQVLRSIQFVNFFPLLISPQFSWSKNGHCGE